MNQEDYRELFKKYLNFRIKSMRVEEQLLMPVREEESFFAVNEYDEIKRLLDEVYEQIKTER